MRESLALGRKLSRLWLELTFQLAQASAGHGPAHLGGSPRPPSSRTSPISQSLAWGPWVEGSLVLGKGLEIELAKVDSLRLPQTRQVIHQSWALSLGERAWWAHSFIQTALY